MEIRARYFVIGLFVLAVVGAAVGFIYWLYNTGGLVKRTDYLVSFNGSVSGLAPGSPVLFNGLQVGEVTGLTLSTDNPELVIARIAIDARTPVRSDTHVGMDFRGLTGTATIALTGGSAAAPPPPNTESGVPLLIADPNDIKDMTASAREALARLNQILSENAEPLKSAIASIDTFAKVLADNSGKVEGILAGLENLTGGGKKAETINFDLAAATEFPDIENFPEAQLAVPTPTTVIALDTQRLMLADDTGTVAGFEGTRWVDSVPILVGARVMQSFENAGYPRVGSDTSGFTGDYQLLLNIRKFQVRTTDTPEAEVAFMAKVLDLDGKVIDAKLFEATAPADDVDAAAPVAAAINAAFGKAAGELVAWALATVSDAAGEGSAEAPPMDAPPMKMPDMPPMPAAAGQAPPPADGAPKP